MPDELPSRRSLSRGQKGQSPDANLRTVPALSASLLTVGHVAESLGVGRETIYRLTQRGELRSTRVGSAVRILPGDLVAYLAQRSKGEP